MDFLDRGGPTLSCSRLCRPSKCPQWGARYQRGQREPVVFWPLRGHSIRLQTLGICCGKIFLPWHSGSRHMCFRSVLIKSAFEALTSCHLVCRIFAESFDLRRLLKQQSHDQRKLLWAHSLPIGMHSCKLDPSNMHRLHTAVPCVRDLELTGSIRARPSSRKDRAIS